MSESTDGKSPMPFGGGGREGHNRRGNRGAIRQRHQFLSFLRAVWIALHDSASSLVRNLDSHVSGSEALGIIAPKMSVSSWTA